MENYWAIHRKLYGFSTHVQPSHILHISKKITLNCCTCSFALDRIHCNFWWPTTDVPTVQVTHTKCVGFQVTQRFATLKTVREKKILAIHAALWIHCHHNNTRYEFQKRCNLIWFIIICALLFFDAGICMPTTSHKISGLNIWWALKLLDSNVYDISMNTIKSVGLWVTRKKGFICKVFDVKFWWTMYINGEEFQSFWTWKGVHCNSIYLTLIDFVWIQL